MGNCDRRWGKDTFSIPTDCSVFPIAIRTGTLCAARSMLTTGVSAAKYMLVASEYIMTVVLFWSARLHILWVQLAVNVLMSGKGEGRDVVTTVVL